MATHTTIQLTTQLVNSDPRAALSNAPRNSHLQSSIERAINSAPAPTPTSQVFPWDFHQRTYNISSLDTSKLNNLSELEFLSFITELTQTKDFDWQRTILLTRAITILGYLQFLLLAPLSALS